MESTFYCERGLLLPFGCRWFAASDWNNDFNEDLFDWAYRGAYSGCCDNKGWHLQLDTISAKETITSIQKSTVEINMEVFPNPVTTYLFIKQMDFKPLEIEIYNVSGKKVYTKKISITQCKIDFSSQPEGLYFLVIRRDDKFISEKIIKI